MPNWEYKLFSSQDVPGEGLFSLKRDRAALEAYVNELARDGWEIVDLDFSPSVEGFYFKGFARRERR